MSALAGPAKIATTGLVLALDAVDKNSYPGSGTTWKDLSGNSDGTFVGGVSYDSANGGSLVFNGSSGHVVASNTSLIHRTSDWAYSVWANFSGTPAYGTFFENGTWGNTLLIRFETNGIAIYSMSVGWGKFNFSPTLGVWYKLDFVRSGNNINFYINGVYSQSMSFTADVQPTSNLFIGESQHISGQCFNGKIAQASIYNRALSATEVLQNYNALKSRYLPAPQAPSLTPISPPI